MRLYRPGKLTGFLYPEAIFRIMTDDKVICLTFDDGPDPDSTPRLLRILLRRNIQGIFFCTGSQAEKYPALMHSIKAEGHLTGNHGYHHLDGFRTSAEIYRQNADAAAPFTSDRLFRPPFGRLTRAQYNDLKTSYTIMFWDVMPYDFNDPSGGKYPLDILKKMIRPGSVIVLHDKAGSTAADLLDEFIDYSAAEGYRFFLPGLS